MRLKVSTGELGYNGNNVELDIQSPADGCKRGTLVWKKNRLELWMPHAKRPTNQWTWEKLLEQMCGKG